MLKNTKNRVKIILTLLFLGTWINGAGKQDGSEAKKWPITQSAPVYRGAVVQLPTLSMASASSHQTVPSISQGPTIAERLAEEAATRAAEEEAARKQAEERAAAEKAAAEKRAAEEAAARAAEEQRARDEAVRLEQERVEEERLAAAKAAVAESGKRILEARRKLEERKAEKAAAEKRAAEEAAAQAAESAARAAEAQRAKDEELLRRARDEGARNRAKLAEEYKKQQAQEEADREARRQQYMEDQARANEERVARILAQEAAAASASASSSQPSAAEPSRGVRVIRDIPALIKQGDQIPLEAVAVAKGLKPNGREQYLEMSEYGGKNFLITPDFKECLGLLLRTHGPVLPMHTFAYTDENPELVEIVQGTAHTMMMPCMHEMAEDFGPILMNAQKVSSYRAKSNIAVIAVILREKALLFVNQPEENRYGRVFYIQEPRKDFLPDFAVGAYFDLIDALVDNTGYEAPTLVEKITKTYPSYGIHRDRTGKSFWS